MPRLTASKPMAQPVAAPRPAASRPRAKKPGSVQDRLSARALFFRRVRRSVKPGLWVMAVVLVLAVLPGIFRSLPTIRPVASPDGSIRHGFAALAGYAGFRVTDIQINGAETTKPEAIRAALGVQTGDPILGLSLAAMQARLEQLGPVQSATVERALPGTLIINIDERAAYAIWQTGGTASTTKFVLIDKQGNVIADQDAAAAKRRNPALVLLVGQDAPPNAQTLLTELATAPAVLSRVIAAERVDGLRWNLVLKNQTVVKLPSDSEAQAITQLAALQTSIALLDRPVEAIDLRLPGRLVIQPYPAPATAKSTGKVPHDGV